MFRNCMHAKASLPDYMLARKRLPEHVSWTSLEYVGGNNQIEEHSILTYILTYILTSVT